MSHWGEISAVFSACAAIAGVIVAVVAVFVAYRQLRELSTSNGELARSNDEITDSNRNLVRPVVVVDYLVLSHPSKDPRFGGSSSVNVIVKNVGVRPACNVVIHVSPPFKPAGDTANEASVMKALDFVNQVMDGSHTIAMIDSARPATYFLARGSDAFEDEAVARQHQVSVRYTDVTGANHFDETYMLDLRAWQVARSLPEPLDRISKDIQHLTDVLNEKQRP
jgi:hypothetical protein